MKPILYIISGGMGKASLYSQESLDLLANTKRILTTARIAEQLNNQLPNIEVYSTGEMLKQLEENLQTTAVIVTGDCGFFSLASLLVKKYKETYEIKSFPNFSSMQYLLSKLNKSYEQVKTVSLHGRQGNVVAAVSYHEKVFLLTDNKNTVKTVLLDLKESGLTHLKITVGENLSSDEERITTDSIEELLQKEFSTLSVMYIENPCHTDKNKRLKDAAFTRGQVPMTKEHIRVLTVDRLEISAKDIVYDIGAGTGSVSVAMAYRAFEGTVYAVEQKQEAVKLIEENRSKLGAFNLRVVSGVAPQAIENLPAPDRVFIGGSGGKLKEILQVVLQKNPQVRVCINTVTLESLNEVIDCFKAFHFTEIEICQMNCARAEKVGKYHMMKAENPVYIISGRGQ